jgi:hypothetical protein
MSTLCHSLFKGHVGVTEARLDVERLVGGETSGREREGKKALWTFYS